MEMDLAKFAVVTGASSGIGFELAREFLENDFDVMIVAENVEIHQAARKLEGHGRQILVHQIDLSRYAGVEELYRKIKATGRTLDAIAINAGVGVGGEFSVETDLDEELRLIQLNVSSTVHLAKRVIPDMVAQGSGKILFTSSIASMMPGPFLAVYSASKAFVQSFAIAIRNELKDSGVTVTSLMPGPTETKFFDRADMEDTPVGQAEKDDPAKVAHQGFKAMMAGKDHVVAGSLLNKIQAGMAKIIPQKATAQIHRKQAQPESTKH